MMRGLIEISEHLRTGLESAARWLAIGFLYAMLPQPDQMQQTSKFIMRSCGYCKLLDDHGTTVTRYSLSSVEQTLHQNNIIATNLSEPETGTLAAHSDWKRSC